MQVSATSKLIAQLDLSEHIAYFRSFFARSEAPIHIEGDANIHFSFINELDRLEFNAPPKVKSFGTIKLHLKKLGVLWFEDIYEIIKVVRYFRYFKNRELEGKLGEWFLKIEIPQEFVEVEKHFLEDGRFNEDLDADLSLLQTKTKEIRSNIAETLRRQIHSAKLSPYLIDTQIHYINEQEALLVRGGFNHVLAGSIIGRSSGGGFYVTPQSVAKLRSTLSEITQAREQIFYSYAKTLSAKLTTLLPFITFIDREFDKLDAYQARVLFAKSRDLSIIRSAKHSNITLSEFVHPALQNAKSVSVDFSKNILMITGVNAGGKTMLLKSLLSATFMAKHMIPQKLNARNSSIGSFKKLLAIIDDPQSVKNDISTFAGRMQEFSTAFSLRDALIGVDEIELGTDSDEAAALFKAMLDELVRRDQKIIITTHHKRLASLMADRDDVELLAAIYDEENRRPTYEFLSGIIGKSYAFETASRYGIPSGIVNEARKIYGEQSERLNALIERGSSLERELRQKIAKVDERLESLEKRELSLKEQRSRDEEELKALRSSLLGEYNKAIAEAKTAAKLNDPKEIHKALNIANALLPKKEAIKPKTTQSFAVGDPIKYRSGKGVIVALSGKDEAFVEVGGMRLRVKLKDLVSRKQESVKPTSVSHKVEVEKKAGLKCDLHGLRAEEATEVLDKFLSDALLNGWDEVIIYHGIGTGKLAYAVKEFLKLHPKVRGFSDAPPQLGGYGAKIVSL